jgi:hypothetical protein
MKRYLMIACAALLISGCTSVKFPQGASTGMHIYVSTPHSPKELTVVDTVTRETLWVLPIPVNHKAAVHFAYGKTWLPTTTGAGGPQVMRWGVFTLDQDYVMGTLANQQMLSGNPVRIEVNVRKKARDKPIQAIPSLGQR